MSELPTKKKAKLCIDIDEYPLGSTHCGFDSIEIKIDGKVYEFTAEHISKFLSYIQKGLSK